METLLAAAKTMEETGTNRYPLCSTLYHLPFSAEDILLKSKHFSSHSFLLESADHHYENGRYSIIGFDPDLEISALKNKLRIKNPLENEVIIKDCRNPNIEIRKILKEYKTCLLPDMDFFTGGLVGYFSYDSLRYQEPKLQLSEKGLPDFKDIDLMLFNSIIVMDHKKGCIHLISGVLKKDLKNSYCKAAKKIQKMEHMLMNAVNKKLAPLKLMSKLQERDDKESYLKKVEKAKEYIRQGDIFQVVYSNSIYADVKGSLFECYRNLKKDNPSPYMFYFSSDDIEIAGSSPETLVKVIQDKVYTYPLAGSRPRGKTQEEDDFLEKELLQDEKELSEHNMLVDLGRNDIGRIAQIGSVKVEEYLNVHKYSAIMHIGSKVSGILKEDKDALDALQSILPAGTLSGAPKFRACEIIDELEQEKRGLYGGCVGYIDFNGSMDMCIAIRLVYKKNGRAVIQSGGGIVYDSAGEREYMERKNKAKAVVKALLKSVGENYDLAY